jgi:hypothetical protein
MFLRKAQKTGISGEIRWTLQAKNTKMGKSLLGFLSQKSLFKIRQKALVRGKKGGLKKVKKLAKNRGSRRDLS